MCYPRREVKSPLQPWLQQKQEQRYAFSISVRSIFESQNNRTLPVFGIHNVHTFTITFDKSAASLLESREKLRIKAVNNNVDAELMSCVKVEVAVLDSPS